MDKWYPVHLDMTGRHCVIIGGGHIAVRRIHGLLEVGAHVTVISPQCHPEILQLAEEGSVSIVQQDYRGEEDLVNADLIFAATNDELVNKWIADDAKKLRIPLNHVGDSKSSTFILPAVLRRGQLIMSVSTSGASPGLAKQIRDELTHHYGDEYKIYVDFLSELREWVMMKVVNERDRAKIFHRVLKFDILELIRVEKLHVLRSWLQIVLDQELQDVDWQQQFKLYASKL
ncbi:MAG: bifunctional precorrin-2 dehydrogenase/sirohydrochlorin ferrochelatase [Paenibacillaceae bacterium]